MSETTAENQSARLIVKNFGPLKDVDIELKDIMVFIGPQASGKSTLAKILHSMFSFPICVQKEKLNKLFGNLNIDFFEKNSLIEIIKHNKEKQISYSSAELQLSETLTDDLNHVLYFNSWSENIGQKSRNISDEIITKEEKEEKQQKILDEVNKLDYFFSKIKFTVNIIVPAERNVISALSGSIMGALSSGVLIPQFISDFGHKFELARKVLQKLYIKFLDITYEYDSINGDKIFISSDKYISLPKTASGFQSVIPLYLVTKVFAKSDTLVIEEPELNLFPETQKKLVEFIIETCRDKTKRLIITTHSPYILTTLNGLIQAHNTARTKPELKDKVAEIIPENRWIDFDKIGVYHVADGTVKKIMDEENRLIDENAIDEVSENLGRIFGDLLELEFHEK